MAKPQTLYPQTELIPASSLSCWGSPGAREAGELPRCSSSGAVRSLSSLEWERAVSYEDVGEGRWGADWGEAERLEDAPGAPLVPRGSGEALEDRPGAPWTPRGLGEGLGAVCAEAGEVW